MNLEVYEGIIRKPTAKIFLLVVYIISVNLLAGYIAVWLRFPSLWGGGNIFQEYAMPFGMTYAMSHWPSIILVGIPLLLLPGWNANQIRRFRLICFVLFLILIYGVFETVPFALFPAVDLFVAFFFSIIIVPPTYKEDPLLTIFMILLLSISVLTGMYVLYSKWQHQTPEIKETELMGGVFSLEAISVDNGYKKEMIFTIELKQHVPQDDVCRIATEMGEEIFDTYPFDETYHKIIKIIFNPEQAEGNFQNYTLGEVEQYEEDGQLHLGCYLKYK